MLRQYGLEDTEMRYPKNNTKVNSEESWVTPSLSTQFQSGGTC